MSRSRNFHPSRAREQAVTGRKSAYLWVWLTVVFLQAALAVSAQAQTFSATGSMATARYLHTATLLPNGKVLVAGGEPNHTGAELYDPGTGTFSPTGSMGAGRRSHTATLLPNGKVLMAGGWDLTAELYDPATGTFTPTGSMTAVRPSYPYREQSTATLLPNGKVLIAGGYGDYGYPMYGAELYDPATGTFSQTGSMIVDRVGHTATLLPNGKVLIAGGWSYYGCYACGELYDPATGTFSLTGSVADGHYNLPAAATLLANGKVLVVFGDPYSPGAELYDPSTGTFSPTGSMAEARYWYTATLLLGGKVLVAGGITYGGSNLARAELYDPSTGTFSATGSMTTVRNLHTATRLNNGMVLVAGGRGPSIGPFPDPSSQTILDSAELYSAPVPGNVPPDITSVSGPTSPLALGNAASVSANFTDANALDTHTCTFSWDDTSSSAGTVTMEPAASSPGQCEAPHTYSAAGVYTVEVTVTDNSQASASATYEFVVIYDPSAGFVTGGGWINSPAGAYAADLSLAGKATFGFVSKYQKGATAPTGQTEFQFQVASFNFHSEVYEWLVVAGHKAQYKGTGTVNGAGNYGFLLTATDGQLSGGGGTDKFRIKIWDKETDTVVYDNVGGSDDIDSVNPQVIAGGNIVIHSN